MPARTSPLTVIVLLAALVLVVGVSWAGGGRLPWTASADDAPPPQPATSSVPLGVPAAAPGTGVHRFAAVQADGTTPVTYDPCRAIPFVTNPRTQPPGGDRLVADALARVGAITGLQFVDEGTTDERPADGARAAYQPDRYGERWAPVLIAWTDEAEVPALAGDVAGEGGSTWIEAASEPTRVYVTGQLALDGPALATAMSGAGDVAQARAVVLHELGHVVGLGHVDDPRELMDERGHTGVTDFQGGDVGGLVALGSGRCVAEL